ncbi:MULTISPECIES: LacI family DNA-binding transcriptional regulator [unclassified Sphingomonas]|uniref:LacI family DNA-binding transcriptional regulator n=1 Tax=unclassified Sphingomonas TaxID=196159 RepID=UPI0006F2AC1A|nr:MULTISPECIES: substrate-binding domain-containing protein [unclassified Sphingomonas]KQN28445.1 LacI family transcriptional regulator [Sphingomonas sp. Leaf34]KQN29561.1 LacI family transcriptional regulator [Sphingomonas sp. Leaf38]
MKLADLAVLAGVSTATVSRALAGHSSVNARTQARIRALAREHDVRPNQLARNLRMKSTGAIGLVLPLGHAKTQHLTDPFFLSLLGFLADLLVERGYDILLSRVIPDADDWLERLVDSGRIDGLLLVGQSDQFAAIERVAQRYRPLVVWGAKREGQHHLTIGSDNFAGGRMAAEHLIAQGRKRLLFVGDPAPPEFADRLGGFAAAAEEAGLPCEVLATPMTPEVVHAAITARLATGAIHDAIPDAIFAASDVAAMSVLRALTEAGIDIPGTTAVIGYDDVTLAAHTSPSLTTIRQDLEIGTELMVDRLLKRIAGAPAESAIVPPTLIQRQSA